MFNVFKHAKYHQACLMSNVIAVQVCMYLMKMYQVMNNKDETY